MSAINRYVDHTTVPLRRSVHTTELVNNLCGRHYRAKTPGYRVCMYAVIHRLDHCSHSASSYRKRDNTVPIRTLS